MRLLATALAVAMAASSIAAAPARAADLKPFAEETPAAIKATHAGQKVIVHVWSLSCSICMAELADWGSFAKAMPGTRLVLINWDERGQDKRIADKLDRTGLGDIESFMLGAGYEEKLRFKLDPTWAGELPRTFLIAGDGTTIAKSGAANFDELKAWLLAP